MRCVRSRWGTHRTSLKSLLRILKHVLVRPWESDRMLHYVISRDSTLWCFNTPQNSWKKCSNDGRWDWFDCGLCRFMCYCLEFVLVFASTKISKLFNSKLWKLKGTHVLYLVQRLGYRLDGRGIVGLFPVWESYCSLLQSFQYGSGNFPASQ